MSEFRAKKLIFSTKKLHVCSLTMVLVKSIYWYLNLKKRYLFRYEILSGNPTGTAVRYAKVGDSVYHKWTCVSEAEDVYCMRVHTCTVNDGQGGEVVEVLDRKGSVFEGFQIFHF